MYAYTHDGVVYGLIRPCDRVEFKPSPFNSYSSYLIVFFLPFVFVQDVMRNSFGMFDNVMSNVRNRMEEMHRNFVSS